jgi:hypothetical protein
MIAGSTLRRAASLLVIEHGAVAHPKSWTARDPVARSRQSEGRSSAHQKQDEGAERRWRLQWRQ